MAALVDGLAEDLFADFCLVELDLALLFWEFDLELDLVWDFFSELAEVFDS